MAHRKLAIFRRRVFTALSVLSLLLCVATLALWVRSYYRLDSIFYAYHTQYSKLTSLRGELAFTVWWEPDEFSFPSGLFIFDSVEIPTPGYLSVRELPAYSQPGYSSGWFLGFGYFAGPDARGSTHAIALPHWFLALLFAIPPALHVRSALRSRRRRRAGHCPRCGYDLRATPERCPECGTEVRSQKSEVSNGKTANPLTPDL